MCTPERETFTYDARAVNDDDDDDDDDVLYHINWDNKQIIYTIAKSEEETFGMWHGIHHFFFFFFFSFFIIYLDVDGVVLLRRKRGLLGGQERVYLCGVSSVRANAERGKTGAGGE